MNTFATLLEEVRACTICASQLSHGVRPVLQIHPSAKILIAGQAPGRVVHETGIPFDDASGNRLREWMGVSKGRFYDEKQIAILPMGFCYPGTGKTGDLPPRPECAIAWREKLLEQFSQLELTLVIGKYAQSYHLPKNKLSLTETVKAWQDHWPKILPLPHPSPRNNIWLKRNSWFETEVIPRLRNRVNELLPQSKSKPKPQRWQQANG
ncbi:uracil-DNA glycosylase family protein [Congregibacter variabilis]|uniref:Uracil-DNA glycosylase family protein n=1 Tax=Congregibacter variabilis TaxID=3081200 RepID=A0ABZ0I9P9_9GAMM|nr:uracil-DNA glycosylase family protein [Congregibacter sp. IMCC43200]